jgi:hypothetical protein
LVLEVPADADHRSNHPIPFLVACLATIGCDATPLPADPPTCQPTPPPGDVTFEWAPCPNAPALATCKYVDTKTGATICIDALHMPVFGVTCLEDCEVSL